MKQQTYYNEAIPSPWDDFVYDEWETQPNSYNINSIEQNIATKKQLEEDLFHKQKMETLGKLVSDVSHDFNNILTVIRSYCGIILTKNNTMPSLKKELKQIEKAAKDGEAVVRQLLYFSRKDSTDTQILNINKNIEDSVQMCSHLFSKKIEISTSLSAYPDKIRANSGQIKQLIMNLLINARDAMPDGGKIFVNTSNKNFKCYSAEEEASSDSYVVLSVTDNGHGIPEEIQSKIFEPFFTSKSHNNGTGLGLSLISDIVKKCNGSIKLDSHVGEGSCFTIYFPQNNK